MVHEPYHTLLQDTFAERRKKNRAYSLRAFSRDLGVSPATLSQVLSYKRTLSRKSLERVCERLSLSPLEIQKLKKRTPIGPKTERHLLEDDVFRLMSDWYYYGIISLSQTPYCPSDAKIIGERLGISSIEARGAIERLERLGLIERRGETLHCLKSELTTTVDIPNSAGKKLQRQHLAKAEEAMDHADILQREITSVTMAIDPKKLKVAKQMIANFRDQLCEFLESGRKEKVYVLGLQLFPVENLKKGDTP